MLAMQVYVPSSALAESLGVLTAHAGVRNLIPAGASPHGTRRLLTAHVDASVVDALLPLLRDHGIEGDDIELIHRESHRPLGVAQYGRAVPQYLVVMACAGVIAVFGVLTSNSIVVVGAMAISPDLLPMCAVCVGLVERRPRLAFSALAALVIGLGVASLAACVTAVGLHVGGFPEANGSLRDGGLGRLPTVNATTVIVAAAAGIAGMLSFETRSSSAVGVAISVTTIPAAAFIGAAAALHDIDGLRGAAAVLAVNVTMLVLGGTITLLVQRARRRHRAAG